MALALFAVAMAITSRTASAQGTGPPPIAAKAEKESMLNIYQKGGWIMHFIALSSIVVIAIISFCAMKISRKAMLPSGFEKSLAIAFTNQDVSSAMKLCEGNESSLSHVVRETFTKAAAGVSVYSKADLEAVAAETIFHEETKYMLWVNMLNALAAIAPMMGLLGTVSGMIGSFDQLAAGASKPSDFAGGIGEAMITTAAALIVAIPSMLAYFVFKNMLQSLISQLALSSSSLISRFVTGMDPVADHAEA
jgi:biopolymer transport protein ExbB